MPSPTLPLRMEELPGRFARRQWAPSRWLVGFEARVDRMLCASLDD